MGYKNLNDEQIKEMQEYCILYEDEFRKFVNEYLLKDKLIISSEKIGYDFYKSILRDKKIDEILNLR